MNYLGNRLGKEWIGDDMAIGNQMDNMLTVREVAKSGLRSEGLVTAIPSSIANCFSTVVIHSIRS